MATHVECPPRPRGSPVPRSRFPVPSVFLDDPDLQLRADLGEEGKLFGSITTADIAEKLGEQGIEVDRKQIQLDEPIKALGVFSVPVRLHAEVRPEVKVWVIKEDA